MEERKGRSSVFNGPPPVIQVCGSSNAEGDAVSGWLRERTCRDRVLPHEIGIFVRSAAEMERARDAASRAGLPFHVLDERVEIVSGHASIGTMHLAKGLEFRVVVVMACDDEVIPSQQRIETAADDSELEDVYNTERHLLYVACTRARDFVFISGDKPASEFLDDLQKKGRMADR